MRKHEEKIFSGAAEPVHDAHAAANYGVCSAERFAGQHTQGKSGDFGAALRLDCGSGDQVLSMLNALGLLDEDGNFKVDQTITLDGQVLTLAAVMELLENPATDLTRIADVDGTPVALGDLKTMIQIEQELQRIKDTYFSGREFTGEALENLNSLMEQLELQGISLRYSASATKPEGVETVDMSGMMSQTLGNLANNTWNSGPFTVYRGKPAGFSYRIQKGQLASISPMWRSR